MREGYFGPGMAGTHYQPPETTDPEGLGGKKMWVVWRERVKVSENRIAEFGRNGLGSEDGILEFGYWIPKWNAQES